MPSLLTVSTRNHGQKLVYLIVLMALSLALLMLCGAQLTDMLKLSRFSAPALSTKFSPTSRLAIIGIVTTARKVERRSMLRSLYSSYNAKAGKAMDVYFVVAKDDKLEYNELVLLEQTIYRDILILDIAENMNGGKTYHYLKFVAELHGFGIGSVLPSDSRPYDFVMKTDDDSLLHLTHIEQRLSGAPKEATYWGQPCESTGVDYMGGSGYALSWDLARWIAQSNIPPRLMQGYEDLQVGAWFKEGNVVKHYVPDDRIYDITNWKAYSNYTLIAHKAKDNHVLIENFQKSLGDTGKMSNGNYVDHSSVPYQKLNGHVALQIDGKCLDASYFYHLTLADCNAKSPAQAWIFDSKSRYISFVRGKCLDVDISKVPLIVELYGCHEGDNQKWLPDSHSSRIISKWQTTESRVCIFPIKLIDIENEEYATSN